MSLLLENFDTILTSPEAVDQFNAQILKWAVQGKLVPQDPGDEPAEFLLEMLRAKRKERLADGKISKPIPKPMIIEEKPFEIPASWIWTTLGEIGEIVGGGTPKTQVQEYWSEAGIPWLTPADLSNFTDKEINSGRRDISPIGLEKSSARLLPKGSVLFSSRAPIGYVAIAATDLATNQGFKSIVPYLLDINQYLYIFLKYAGDEINKNASGTTFKEVSGKEMKRIQLPLPPLAEQLRIVEKVEILLDQTHVIKEQLIMAEETQRKLNQTSLYHLTSAQSKNEFQKRWTFIKDNFDLLYTHPENVAELKQTILQLAVQGKLVPQDPNDEPASVLLERIKTEKARLVKEGKIKKSKSLPPTQEYDKPLILPPNWSWESLGNLAKVITKGSSPKWQGVNYSNSEEDGILFITSKNVGNFNLLLDNKTYVENKFNVIEPRSILKQGDILMNIVGASIGRTAIFNLSVDANINQAVCLIRLIDYVNKDYILYFLNSTLCIDYMFSKQVENARANLSMGNISKFLIPIPPLAEQCRIVEKVKSLFFKVETLKKEIERLPFEHEKLVSAILANS